MADIERVSVEEARRRVQAGQALLVCAYEDEDKCRKMKLEGATSLGGLQARRPPAHQEQLIFYCA